jgi:hypothetical protein
VRLSAVADSNFSYWHSATFNNDGTQGAVHRRVGRRRAAQVPRHRQARVGRERDLHRVGNEMRFQSYYKLPAPQTAQENCVAHNGSLIPIPGRDVMVQSWYQGGISVFDWTDAASRSRSPTSTAARSRRRGWATAGRGRSTGTTACS